MSLFPSNFYVLEDFKWLFWNLFLAFIPFFLSFYLFRKKTTITKAWWLVFFLFVLFLPNAPYILTDISHLYTLGLKLESYPTTILAGVEYTFFLVIGVLFFINAYQRFEEFTVHHTTFNRYLFRATTFTILSMGVYLGKFPRLNSWDLILNPYGLLINLKSLLALQSLAYITSFTFIMMLIYYLHYNFLKFLHFFHLKYK